MDKLMEYLQNRFPNNDFTLKHGRKYVLIIEKDSAYCFVAKGNFETKTLGKVKCGDLLKPATFKTPAKHARGSLFDESTWENAFGKYGMKFLK